MMKAFFRHGRKIASFAPSSRFMARKIADGIDWEQAKCIVEQGAGTGPITAEIVKRVRPQTKLLVIELDPSLCGRLKARSRMSPTWMWCTATRLSSTSSWPIAAFPRSITSSPGCRCPRSPDLRAR